MSRGSPTQDGRTLLVNGQKNASMSLSKKPIEMARILFMSVIFMSVIAKSDIDLLALEEMTEDAVKEKINDLTNLIEQYACGGFSIMQNAIGQNPEYYRQEDFFLNLLMINHEI